MNLRTTLATAAAGASLLLTAACGSSLPSSSSSTGASTSPSGDSSMSTSSTSSTSAAAGSSHGSVRIASQNFPEAALVAEMYKELLANAGYSPSVKLVGTRDAYMASFPGTVDVVPEYVGGIVNFLNSAANGANAKPFNAGNGEALAKQGKSLLAKKGITLLQVSAATDTNAFFTTKAYAKAHHLTDLSSLKGQTVTLAAAPDCEGRLDCAGGLESKYGIKIAKVLELGYASAQTFKSVQSGESQLGETSTTDGTLDSQGMMLLPDDKHIQPAQNLVPAVATSFLKAHPDIEGVLDPLMQKLTTANLTQLNGEISVDRESTEDVAHQFLTQAGLLS
jgi:osmoprotectant transport system substrate-binding protein